VVDPALAARRRIPLKAGPLDAILPVDTIPPRAVVTVGWRGVEAGNERDRQVLDLAARIVSDRLIEELRERRGLAYRFSCDSTPAVGLVGTGTLAVQVVTEPRRARWVAALGRALVERLAREGPDSAELVMARRQRANERQHDEADPDFWADTLSTLDLRGVDLGEVATEPDRLRQITSAEVRDVLARYVSNERRFQAVALPRPSLLASSTAPPAAVSTTATAVARRGRSRATPARP
jgi:predicted Zn-dependent peptidase